MPYKINGKKDEAIVKEIRLMAYQVLSSIDCYELSIAKLHGRSLISEDVLQLIINNLEMIWIKVEPSRKVDEYEYIPSYTSDELGDLVEAVRVKVICDNYIFTIIIEFTGITAETIASRLSDYDPFKPIKHYIKYDDIQVELDHIET